MLKLRLHQRLAVQAATAFAVALPGVAFANPVVLPDPVPHAAPAASQAVRVVAPPKLSQEAPAPAVQTVVAGQPQAWLIRAGQPIHTQIKEWAMLAGWDVQWKLEKSWVAPANIEFKGDFLEALSSLISGLYKEGRPVQMTAWKGNRYAEIVDSQNSN